MGKVLACGWLAKASVRARDLGHARFIADGGETLSKAGAHRAFPFQSHQGIHETQSAVQVKKHLG